MCSARILVVESEEMMDSKTATEIVGGLNNQCHSAETDKPMTSEEKRIACRKRANKARRERNQVMRDLGLVRVRGALGGTYWE
jgi:hypothetical protein